MADKACRNCKYITNQPTCPNCSSTNLTDKWNSYLCIFDIERSELGKKFGAKLPGRYAIRIKN